MNPKLFLFQSAIADISIGIIFAQVKVRAAAADQVRPTEATNAPIVVDSYEGFGNLLPKVQTAVTRANELLTSAEFKERMRHTVGWDHRADIPALRDHDGSQIYAHLVTDPGSKPIRLYAWRHVLPFWGTP